MFQKNSLAWKQSYVFLLHITRFPLILLLLLLFRWIKVLGFDASPVHIHKKCVLTFPCHFFFLSFYSSIEASSLSFLSKTLSRWWSFFFHGLFPSGWCLLSPFLLYLSLQLHGWKSPLKDLIESQRSSLRRSFSRKLLSSGIRAQELQVGAP